MSPRLWYWMTAVFVPLLLVLPPALIVLRAPTAPQAPWIACIALAFAAAINALAPVFGRCPDCGQPSRPAGMKFPERCTRCTRPL